MLQLENVRNYGLGLAGVGGKVGEGTTTGELEVCPALSGGETEKNVRMSFIFCNEKKRTW